jgi:tetratricopeptide (TPR) repeat protein
MGSIAFFNLGQLDKAEKNVTEALSIAPESVEALDILGSIHMVRSQNTFAIDALTKATTINPKFWRSHYNLAVLHSRMGNVQAAIMGYIRAFLLKPSFTTTLPVLTTSLYLYPALTRIALIACFLIPLMYQNWTSLIFTSIMTFMMITLGVDRLKLKDQKQGFQLIVAGLLASSIHSYLILF